MKRDTVGKISSELAQKQPESRDPIELQREMQKDYVDNIILCVEENKKKIVGNFYVVVITKNERLMPNVFRNYFLARTTCPTPDYDQTLYKYNFAMDRIEYLWTIPSRDACHHLKDNALIVHPSERELLSFVLSFENGSLFRLAKELNNEQDDSDLLKGDS